MINSSVLFKNKFLLDIRLGNFRTLISVGQEAKQDVSNIASEPVPYAVCLCLSCLLLTQLYLKVINLIYSLEKRLNLMPL